VPSIKVQRILKLFYYSEAHAMLFPNHPAKMTKTASRPAQRAVPATLPLQGRVLRHSGRGRMPGSQLYIDLASARPYELFSVRVSFAGPAYFLGEVLGNASLAVVRITRAGVQDAAGVQTGDVLLAGPLEFDADQMARMPHGWRLAAPAAGAMTRPVPGASRCLGVVNRIHTTGKFGQITSASGRLLFFHVSQLQPGATVQVGQRVSFVEVLTERGWNAVDVRLA
jgi:cold shock CspA family protein